MCKVRPEKMVYSEEPQNASAYTENMDKIYTRFAKAYDGFITLFPIWKKWLKSVQPYVRGQSLLDVSFGPGYLFRKYPKDMMLYGLDYNAQMVMRAKQKTVQWGVSADIQQGKVEALPYADASFDTVINTMAFSGYPDGKKAMAEMLRVLRDDGVLLLLDYDYPANRNVFGYWMVRAIVKSGDIVRDVAAIVDTLHHTYERKTIGGFGSVQLFIIRKKG